MAIFLLVFSARPAGSERGDFPGPGPETAHELQTPQLCYSLILLPPPNHTPVLPISQFQRGSKSPFKGDPLVLPRMSPHFPPPALCAWQFTCPQAAAPSHPQRVCPAMSFPGGICSFWNGLSQKCGNLISQCKWNPEDWNALRRQVVASRSLKKLFLPYGCSMKVGFFDFSMHPPPPPKWKHWWKSLKGSKGIRIVKGGKNWEWLVNRLEVSEPCWRKWPSHKEIHNPNV
jgi:hypothetical protein